MTTMPEDTESGKIQVLTINFDQAPLASGGAAASSAAFNPQTQVIRVIATEDIYLRFDAACSNQNTILPAGVIEYFKVRSITGFLSVMQVSAAGSVRISEMS